MKIKFFNKILPVVKRFKGSSFLNISYFDKFARASVFIPVNKISIR
jgi:hypothetical protein